MRPLTDRQANSCEHAKTKRCRCRCGGALHGAARVGDRSQLPSSDPHGPGSGQIQLQPDPLDATVASATEALVDHLAQRAEPISSQAEAPVVSFMDALRASIAAASDAEVARAAAVAPKPWQDVELARPDPTEALLEHLIPEAEMALLGQEDDGSDEDPEAYE